MSSLLLIMASRVSLLHVKPNSTASLTALIMRRASSVNLCVASPTVLIVLSFMSAKPPYRSIMSFIAPLDRVTAMALTVKSRL